MPKTAVRNRLGSFTYTAEVEVEIDCDDLADAGYHHEDDCPSTRTLAPGSADLTDALASLHRQAHPSSHRDPWICHEEPCRSLPLDVLQRSMSSR